MQGASKTESHNSSDQQNPLNFSNEESRDVFNSTINENTYIDKDQYRMFSEIPSQNILPLNITSDQMDRYVFEPQPISDKKSKSLIRIDQNQEGQVVFRGIGGKKVTMTHGQIYELMDRKRSIVFEKTLYCWQIIQTVVKKICIKYYDFEPLSVRVDTFTLTVAQDNQQKRIGYAKMEQLLQYSEVSLGRVARKKDHNRALDEAKHKKKDEQAIQLLSPDEQDIVETIDKSKSIANFKQKISSFYPQLIGEMILITYTDFKKVSNSTRIADLPQHVLQIYQLRKTYIDPTFLKHQTICPFVNKKQYSIVRQEPVSGEMPETEISQSKMYGKLTLKIVGDVLTEKYSGGVLSYLMGDRVRQLPLITLGGANVEGSTLRLSFQLKNGAQICTYFFDNEDTLKMVLTNILVITRNYSHAVELLE